MKTGPKILILLCIAVGLVFASCSKDDDETDSIEIGDFHEGGVIFYLDSTGEHGLVCAVLDQSAAAEWGCMGIPITEDANGDEAIGTGSQNTQHIESGCNTVGTAADIASNLTLNGFSDWFLPSKDELNQMYVNKALIDATALANGGTTFVTSNYWSSTQDDSIKAWDQSFNNGNQGAGNKNDMFYVRSVRAF